MHRLATTGDEKSGLSLKHRKPQVGSSGDPSPSETINFIRRVPVLACLGLSLFASPFLYAQIDTGTFLGMVALLDGSPASSAQVTVRRIDTNEAVELLCNETGNFRRDGLQVGRYQSIVQLEGFRTRDHYQ